MAFSTDTTDVIQLVPTGSNDFNTYAVVEVTREQIASGQVFFSSNPSPDNVGKSADFEFNVKDSSGDLSITPGLIRVSILDAPSSVEESIVDSKYESILILRLDLIALIQLIYLFRILVLPEMKDFLLLGVHLMTGPQSVT